MKAAFYGRLAARLRESPGIRPEDVMVVIADSTADDWSLAGGAQWRPGEGIPRKGDETPFDRSVPRLAELTRDILFGDVWERPQLAPRDRSLVTLAVLVALGRVEQLPFHLKRAVENGVSRDELGELVTHVAFYAGWPAAASAATRLDDFLAAGRDL